MSEAVLLAHALAARLAELESVRILFIKGPTAVALGARPPRPSTDVDALCEPGGLEKLGPALERCGWRRRVPEEAHPQFVYSAKFLFEHSAHYIHDEWPCDLDIHFNFPGFFAPEQDVFEALWQRHTTTLLANYSLPCPDFLGQTLIVALHALREPGAERSHADLAHLSKALTASPSETRAALSRLAAATGCEHALGPLLKQIGAAPASTRVTDPDAEKRWTVRSQSSSRTTTWWLELIDTPWGQRHTVIRRALVPHAHHFAAANAGKPLSGPTLLRWRLRRLRTAIPHLLNGFAQARRLRREK